MYIAGLMENCGVSGMLAMELQQFCPKPQMWISMMGNVNAFCEI